MFKFRWAVMMLIGFILFPLAPAQAQGPGPEKILLKSEAGGFLYHVTPSGGAEKDALLLLELNGNAKARGRQHGLLLADEIAHVIRNRYGCDAAQAALPWVGRAYQKMLREHREEISALRKALRQRGYDFSLELVVLHATQPLVFDGTFPWAMCPWEEPANPSGSFSYAIWRDYVVDGGTITAHSPDWGKVPRSWAANRTVFSVRPSRGYSFAYLGVPGVIGMPGFNATGLAISGTAGHKSITPVTPMPENGVEIQKGFLTPFLFIRQVLQYLHAGDPGVIERVDALLAGPGQNPVDGFIMQVTVPGRSVVWESGAAASQDYPRNSRREAGAWDKGDIVPIDYRGDFLLTRSSGVLRISALPFSITIAFSESNGEMYSGTATVSDSPVRWQRMQLGRGFFFPADPERGRDFAEWFAGLSSGRLLSEPFSVSGDGNGRKPDVIVSVRPDKTSGFWVSDESHGSWVRDTDEFRAFSAAGTEVCAGPLYDFGNGVAGWCRLGGSDIEFVAWTHQRPAGAGLRNDGMNLSVIPAVKPWARPGPWRHGGPHNRTHFLMRELGEPSGSLDVEGFFRVFQRAYLNVGAEDDPFGSFFFSPESGIALFTASRYEGGRYLGALNPEQVPVVLDRSWFGW